MQTEDNRKFGGVGVGKNTRRKDATKEQEHIMHENNWSGGISREGGKGMKAKGRRGGGRNRGARGRVEEEGYERKWKRKGGETKLIEGHSLRIT